MFLCYWNVYTGSNIGPVNSLCVFMSSRVCDWMSDAKLIASVCLKNYFYSTVFCFYTEWILRFELARDVDYPWKVCLCFLFVCFILYFFLIANLSLALVNFANQKCVGITCFLVLWTSLRYRQRYIVVSLSSYCKSLQIKASAKCPKGKCESISMHYQHAGWWTWDGIVWH